MASTLNYWAEDCGSGYFDVLDTLGENDIKAFSFVN